MVFLLATSLPFLIQSVRSGSSSAVVNFVPLQNVYHQIYHRDNALLDRWAINSGQRKRIRNISCFRPQSGLGGEKLNPEHSDYLSPSLSSTLRQVYITIKTTQKYHYPRLVILLETWVSLVRENTWFFTDSDTEDPELMGRTGEHLVVTNCSSSHHRLSLCCKMEQEFQYFLRSHKQWWCHFDDDNFVNVAALGLMLEKYDSDKPWYLGKTSTASPLKIMTMDRKVKGLVFYQIIGM